MLRFISEKYSLALVQVRRCPCSVDSAGCIEARFVAYYGILPIDACESSLNVSSQ